MPVTAGLEIDEPSKFRLEDIAFSSIPGQSKLFLDYLNDPQKHSDYFPSAVSSIIDLTKQVPEVLAGYEVDRSSTCSILMRQNIAFGSGPATFENIERLNSSDCVAVLTGQQAGLYLGPLYSIYKALSAIKAAKILSGNGTPAVPIFWIASEDHDYEEVAKTFVTGKTGGLFESKYTTQVADIGKPVGAINFDDSIAELIEESISELSGTEFTDELQVILRNSYRASETFASAFAKMMASLFAKYGLIIFDPMDAEAKRLAGPITSAAIEHSNLIVEAVIKRSRELEAAGYHAQVLVEKDYFPLFWFDETGVRRSLKGTTEETYRATGSKREFTIEELNLISEEKPESLSPGVMLRPIVQDFLFPTICYFGGGAEIAYFAQNSETYRILGRRPTAILHRNSFTLVDPKHLRSMNRYGLKYEDLFVGLDGLQTRIVDGLIDPATPIVFADVEERINIELNRLDQTLSRIDPTLADSLAKRRQKIIYHIDVLRSKARRVTLERDETAKRQLSAMFNSLTPFGGLQERTLGLPSFFNSYGRGLIDWIYESVDLENKDHRILYL